MTLRKNTLLSAESGGEMGSTEDDRTRRYLDACRAVADGMGCPPKLEKVATDVLPRIVSALGADGGAIYLLAEQGACCELFAHHGLPPDLAADYSSLDPRDLVGPGSFSQPSILRADAEDAGSIPQNLGFVSVVLVPLRTEGEQTGTLLLGSQLRRSWCEHELLLLEALGMQLSTNLTIAHLYEHCQREEAQLRAMSSVAFSVGRADLDEVLSAALAAALELANLETGAVLLLDERSNLVSVRVAQGPCAELALRVPPVSVEDGLTGLAIRTGMIQVSEDVPSDERLAFDMLREGGFRTLIFIPLVGRDRIVGTINLSAQESLHLDSEDLAYLQAIGNQVGMVIENAQLYAQTRRRLEHRSAVHDTVLEIVGRLDITDLLRAIVERATNLLHAKGGGLFLYHAEKGELEVVVSHQLSRDYTGTIIRVGEGAAGRAVLTGEPVLVSDYRTYPNRANVFPVEAFASVAAVPLRWGETILGVLDVVNDVEEKAFDDADVSVLQLFAAHAAIALQNARMYAEIKRQFDESQALLKVSQGIMAATDLQSLLDLIVGAAVEVIPGAQAGVIHLLNAETEELIIRAISYRPGAVTMDPAAGVMKFGQGIAGYAIREKRVMNIPDVDQDPRFIRFPHSRLLKSILVAPLMLGGEKLGTLSVDSEVVQAFGADDERLLTLLSAQASTAIDNARLHEDTIRRSQELREAYSALREMESMKDDFIARVSHELRSPLAPMRIAVERTLSEAFGPLNSVQREMLEIALVNVDRLSATITELLDVVSLSTGGEEPLPQAFDLRLLVRGSVRAMRPRTEAKDIEVHVDIPDTPVLVLANQHKIGQVISNLLSNAIKFNRPSGKAVLRIREVGEEWAELSVSDTGIGIPKDALDSVFTRFYQVGSSLTREYEGLGLGLAIAKDHVEQNGGTIRVESEEGKGSKFTFTVPLA
ncbi:MAG: GAF domain-containing protein [Chloroflexota bacterium]